MTTGTYTQAQTKQLYDLGFSDADREVRRRLIMDLAGREKSGKTHLALTAPGPVIFFNIDVGTEGVVHKFQDSKHIYIYDVRVPKDATKDIYETMWRDLKHRMTAAYSFGSGTVVVDTGTEAFELARLAHFGKLTQVMPHHYMQVNSEWRELLRAAYDSSMNTIFIHKMKPKWVNNARTNEYEESGFGEMPYMSQINVTVFREDQEGGGSEFGLIVRDCRQNPNLNGVVFRGPLCSFSFLLGVVHGK